MIMMMMMMETEYRENEKVNDGKKRWSSGISGGKKGSKKKKRSRICFVLFERNFYILYGALQNL